MRTETDWIHRATQQLRATSPGLSLRDALDMAFALAEREHWETVSPERAIAAAFRCDTLENVKAPRPAREERPAVCQRDSRGL
jgi:hypothetical protein